MTIPRACTRAYMRSRTERGRYHADAALATLARMPCFARFRALVSSPASEAKLGLQPRQRPQPARTLFTLLVVLCLGLFVASCNTTPTLPLPPPVASAGTPDSQGFALVEGQAQALSYVSVLNERTDAGVIT